MFEISPFFIPLAVFAGGVLSPIVGWARAYLDTKKTANVTPTPIEKLDLVRVGTSAIIAAIAAFLFLGQYATAVSVGLPDIEIAFVAGFGADKIVKNAIGI